MRAVQSLVTDIDRQLEGAVRAKQQLETERWREHGRPQAIRMFADRTRKLPWSRALVKLVVEELFPDDLFQQLVGTVDDVPRHRWPQVVAIALALRHSWRRDGLARLARQLHIALPKDALNARSTRRRYRREGAAGHHARECAAPHDAVKGFRCAPTPGGARALDSLANRADGRALT